MSRSNFFFTYILSWALYWLCTACVMMGKAEGKLWGNPDFFRLAFRHLQVNSLSAESGSCNMLGFQNFESDQKVRKIRNFYYNKTKLQLLEYKNVFVSLLSSPNLNVCTMFVIHNLHCMLPSLIFIHFT